MNANRNKRAFSLIEVVLSLAIFVFVGIAMIGLLGVGLQNSQDSRERTQAATIVEAMCATRRAAPTNNFTVATSPQPGFPLPVLNTSSNNLGASGTPVYLTWDGATNTLASGTARFGFLYNINPTGTSPGASSVYLCLYWPAQASPNTAQGHYEVTTTFALP